MRIIQSRDEFKIYDPRENEDKKIDTYNKRIFSSLKNDFLVIEAYKKISFFKSKKIDTFKFTDIDLILKKFILRQRGTGFFSFSPVTDKVKQSNISELYNIEPMNDSILGYFDIAKVDQVMELYKKTLSYEEWIIGSCISKFKKYSVSEGEKNIETVWNIDFLLSQADNINCLYYYNADVDFIIFMTKIFDGIDTEIDFLKRKG